MRSARLRLLDILDAIDEVTRFMPEDRAAFDDDRPLQSHIYRHVMIIGEAVWRLPSDLKATQPSVPWKQIEKMRHVLVHDYFRVSWNMVYSTARNDAPALRSAIEAMLASLPPES